MLRIVYSLLICSLFLLQGCRIGFQAEARVQEDGSIERITAFRAERDADREMARAVRRKQTDSD